MIVINGLLPYGAFYQTTKRLVEALTSATFCKPSQPNKTHTPAIIKSLYLSQRPLVLQRILNSSSSSSSSSFYYSRQNLVRTSPPKVLMIQICHFAHIFV